MVKSIAMNEMVIPDEIVMNKIYLIRGVKVMLDKDLNRAIMVNIQIIRIFTRIRSLIESQSEILQKLDKLGKHETEQDENIVEPFAVCRLP
jgi:hypothetical protein